MSKGRTISPESECFFFSEEKYMLAKPEAFPDHRIAILKETPTTDKIFGFIKALYGCAKFRYMISHTD